MCDHGTMTVVTTPDWFWEERHHPEKGIAIDSCIADDLAAAWEAGVRTLGCCCGHGDETPSVVLTQDPEQPELARGVLPGWTLLQWQLLDVTASPPPGDADRMPCSICLEPNCAGHPGEPDEGER